jgi:hypothetical protein
MVRRTRPGISRFRVRCFASPRNDEETLRSPLVLARRSPTHPTIPWEPLCHRMKPRANRNLSLLMAEHSGPKDGVASARLCRAIHPLCYSSHEFQSFPGCCAAPSARLRASSTCYDLRRDALLIRGPLASVEIGPGSAEQREERCTASGTRAEFALAAVK